MGRFLTTTVIALLPFAASAQSQLDRMESVSETMNEAMVVMMVREMEANGADAAPLMAVLPDLSWDAPMRDAGRCMLERYSETIGEAGVDDMLDRMETFAADVEALGDEAGTLDQIGDPDAILPAGMSHDDAMQITQACGMFELQLQRMQDSGFAAAMMEAAQ